MRTRRTAGVAALALLVAGLEPATVPRAASAATEPTPDPRLAVTLEPETVTVGERVVATLRLSAPRDAVGSGPRFPVWRDSWGDAEILEVGPLESNASTARDAPDGRKAADVVTWSQRLTLAAFRTGEVALPPREIVLPGNRPDERSVLTTSPPALSFTVESVLPAGADPDAVEPAPPAALRELPVGDTFWWTLAIAGLLTASAIGAVLLRSRTDRPGRTAGHTRPYDELRKRLDALAGAAVAGSAAPTPEVLERGCVELSHALRRYLGRSLDFPAAESTTTEVRRGLRERRAPEAVVGRTDRVLRSCDRVKFARRPVEASTLRNRIEEVRELARALEEHLRPAGEAGKEAA